MERDDSAVVATFFSPAPDQGAEISLSDDATHHARVKRLERDDRVRLVDGTGRIAVGTIREIDRKAVRVQVEWVEVVPAPTPIHLCAPIADRDRMLWLAEKATELGITSWRSVRFRRSSSVSPRGEGPAFAEKLRARMISALEQSGGAWLPQLLPDVDVHAVSAPPNASSFVLNRSAISFYRAVATATPAAFALVVGPEGGIEPSELEGLVARGWRVAALADTTLRFETAGVAAIAIARAFASGGESSHV